MILKAAALVGWRRLRGNQKSGGSFDAVWRRQASLCGVCHEWIFRRPLKLSRFLRAWWRCPWVQALEDIGPKTVFSHWVTRWAQALRLQAFRSHLTFRFAIWLENFYKTPKGQNSFLRPWFSRFRSTFVGDMCPVLFLARDNHNYMCEMQPCHPWGNGQKFPHLTLLGFLLPRTGLKIWWFVNLSDAK